VTPQNLAPLPAAKGRYRSKTVTAWLALLLGAAGVHRWYLHGWRDFGAWCFLLPSVLGLIGVLRMRTQGLDDQTGWLLAPLLGLSLSAAMLAAIVHALTPDEKWDARFNPDHAAVRTGWCAVMAAMAALLFGGTVLMGTVAFGGQKFFEWQLETAAADQNKVKTKID
jgi:hypothetical protein